MTTSPILLGAGFVAASLAGGGIVHSLSSAPVTVAPNSSVTTTLNGQTPVLEQLKSLAQATESIQRRLEMLESAGPMDARTALGVDGEPAVAPEIAAAVEAYMSRADVDQGAVRDLVASTLTDIRTQEDIDRDQERADRDAARFQTRIDRLTEDLGLYGDQAGLMFDTLTNEETRRDELRDLMRGDSDDAGAAREEMRNLRDTTSLALEQFLTAEQLESYKESDNGPGGRGGGGRGGFGG